MRHRDDKRHARGMPATLPGILFLSMWLIFGNHLPALAEEAGTPAGTAKTVIEKDLPVRPQYTGNPAFGYEVAAACATPDTVLLRGAADLLSGICVIHTHTIDISGASETISREVALDLPENVDVLSLTPPATATIVIQKTMTEKTFTTVPVHGINTSYHHIIRPASIDIKVRGAMLFFEKSFTKEQIAVFVDLENLEPGLYVKPAVIDLPEKLVLTEAEPRIFTVEVTPAENRNAEE